MSGPDELVPARGARRVRVVVVDDQPLVRMGLRTLVDSEDDLELVGEAEDGRAALDLLRRTRPDVALMDIRMPRLDGIEAMRAVAADPALAGVRVVVLTTFETDEHVFDALQAGAAGFLVKDSEPADMLRAIRLAAVGESLLSPSVTRRVIASFAGRGPARRGHERLGELTEREREVLALIGEGLSNDEIGARLVVSPATARTHVSRVMTKLGARDRAQLVVIAYQSGLVR
ncbi:response regulator [Microlunatus flavus]|uniref:DNA-binding response regulator, NarL/FixJ family, contains REC and HTH domains n=1 Tax=Microlunatus flavus TaxID=1036181 RepID=A0A1H9N569_9ACTN|nr:response regulator transcription factor [Microlunatus flavus]SER30785.1 DNA-binding response regulator, NarL/FixJ family, contains REC and HTH domains [Microlunatus flavus]